MLWLVSVMLFEAGAPSPVDCDVVEQVFGYRIYGHKKAQEDTKMKRGVWGCWTGGQGLKKR